MYGSRIPMYVRICMYRSCSPCILSILWHVCVCNVTWVRDTFRWTFLSLTQSRPVDCVWSCLQTLWADYPLTLFMPEGVLSLESGMVYVRMMKVRNTDVWKHTLCPSRVESTGRSFIPKMFPNCNLIIMAWRKFLHASKHYQIGVLR